MSMINSTIYSNNNKNENFIDKTINNLKIVDVKYKFESLKNNNKVINVSYRKSRKNKDKFFILEKDSEFLVATKYKKRYKYLNFNDLSLIVLNYKNNKIKRVITGEKNNQLIDKLAKNSINNGEYILDLSDGFKVVADNVDVTTMYIYNIFNNIYENDGNPYTNLKLIWGKTGIYRLKTYSKNLSDDRVNKLLKRVDEIKSKKIFGNKIEKKFKISKNEIKVLFENGSFFTMQKNGAELNVTIMTHSKKGVKLETAVLFEKEVESWIVDNTEEFVEKHFSWKGLIKYLIFSVLIALTLFFTFQVIYKTSSKISLYSLAGNIVNSQNRFVWISLGVWIVCTKTLNAWKLKRMLSIQGEKVQLRHLFISGVMGSVISFITPFTIGGDAIGYWYLRRKGFKRGPLAATFISDTLLYQAKFTLQTVILVTIGYPIYQLIFASGSKEAQGALIWFIVGLSWTIFATFMIFSLVLWKSFQEWIISRAIKITEWVRFINIIDPAGLLARYQYEFSQMRKGMKIVWGNLWVVCEMTLYSMAPLFLNPSTIVFISSGLIFNEVNGVNGYIATIVVDDIIGTANSMSITPGGSGTGEWLVVTTRQFIYRSKDGASSQAIASSIDFMWKMFYTWPIYVMSAILIPTIITIENRRIIIRKHNKNYYLSGVNKIKTSKLKLYFSIGWIFVILGFLAYFFLLF